MSASTPETAEILARLGAIWAERLGCRDVAPEDGFFRLGGDSLAATMMLTQVREEFGVSLSLRALFQHETLRGVAQTLEKALHDQAAQAQLLQELNDVGPAE